MSKKVSEQMEQLDYTFLENIDLTEEQVEDISCERIKQKAMAGIQVIPLKEKRFKTKKMKRIMLPLVAAVAIMGVTAVGLSSNEHVRNLFGEHFGLIEGQVQEIKQEDRKNGLIFRAEEAIIDNRSGYIIISCEREDGETFEEDSMFRQLTPRLAKRGGMGWSTQYYLSDEKTKLFGVIDLSSSEVLYNNQLTVEGETIGKWRQTIVDSDMSVAALRKRQQELFEGLACDEVSFQEEILGLTFSYEDKKGEQLYDARYYLKDSRTGNVIESVKAGGGWDSETERSTLTTWFEGIKEEDMPYLYVGAEWRYFDALTEGKWQVSFSLDKNKQVRVLRPNVTVERNNLKLRIKELEVSALGVKVKGTKNTALLTSLNMALLLADGTQKPLTQSAMSTNYNRYFTYQAVLGETPQVEDTTTNADTEENTVEPQGEKGYAISSVTRPVGDGLYVPNLIAMDEVVGIVIEGTTIWLK